MANENMIEGGPGESSPQNKRAQSEKEPWRATDDLKSATPSVAEDYIEKGSKGLDEAKERLGALQDEGGEYVRENPMKAVFTALGVGFMLGFILKRH